MVLDCMIIDVRVSCPQCQVFHFNEDFLLYIPFEDSELKSMLHHLSERLENHLKEAHRGEQTNKLAKEAAQEAMRYWLRQGFYGHWLKKEINWGTFERIELQKRRNWLFPEGYDIHEGRSKP